MILLKLITFIFIAGLIAIIVFGVSIAWRIRGFVNSFKKQNNTGKQQRQTTTGRNPGNEVIDNRDPHKAGQKIFNKDEGEYVDYTVEEDDKKH